MITNALKFTVHSYRVLRNYQKYSSLSCFTPSVKYNHHNFYYEQRRGAHKNADECPPPKRGKAKYFFAGTVLLTSAVIGYAKYDPEFRGLLNEYVPGSDDAIAVIFQEKTSFLDYISKALDSVTFGVLDSVTSLFSGTSTPEEKEKKRVAALPPCDEEQKPYKPPRSAFKPLLDEEKKDDIVKYSERRKLTAPKPPETEPKITTMTAGAKPVEKKESKSVDKQDKESSQAASDAVATHPHNLVELEEKMGSAAQVAIKAYTDAICVLRDQAEDIYKLVEESVEKVDPKIWPQIKEKSLEKEKLVKEAEVNARIAEQTINKLKASIENPKLQAPAEMKEKAKKNMQKILKDVAEAKKVFEKEKMNASVTDKYWGKVEEARKYFSEELEILFPNVRLSEKQLKLTEGEIDLFILYAFQNILYYQKELSKLDTLGEMRIKSAVEQSKSGDPDIVKAAVEAEIEKERRKIVEDFQKRTLNLRAECERDIRIQLKRQAEAHSDHLQEAMALKEKEVERRLHRKVEEKIIEERTKFKEELAGMVGRLKGLDEAIKSESLLFSAKDPLVDAVIVSIPKEALDRGVYSQDALRERFLKVEKVASTVALVPEQGAALPLILLSYLQNFFIIKNPIPIPAYELANEPIDPSALNTYDILQRARYWMERGDFAQTLRYMNLLKGAPRAIAKDWIKETQIMLETLQAANVLLTHASASGLVYS
ncbi:MICOS complex subunit Mic60-like [Nilaparvata lugens]|uniref:MICOS complex subunit Mic60-like n=1 Tax=Nilaparvata lugens TaxID=108931 RepID=UPI00193DDF4C|nr:MICOS complex subunit Mic60-like [Nilaparvata lugens]